MADEWTWDLEPDHWIELTLQPTGLAYVGVDWRGPSGGGYMAGFQSVDQFLDDGPICGMPDAIAVEVRAALAGREGHTVTVRLDGAVPDQVHIELDGQAIMLGATCELFSGRLTAGAHRVAGLAIYSGADDRGRRVQKRFDHPFEVTGDLDVVITELEPRWSD